VLLPGWLTKINTKSMKIYIEIFNRKPCQSPQLRLCETLSWAKSHLQPTKRPGLAWLFGSWLGSALGFGLEL